VKLTALALLALPLAITLAAAQHAEAQTTSFDDFSNLGLLEDRRHEPSPLRVNKHTLDPTLNLKIFDVTTPHVFGSAAVGYSDNVLRGDHDAPGVRLRREPFGRFEAGTRLDTEFGDHRLELEYRGIVKEYWETGRFDTLEHGAQGRLDLYFVDVEGHVDLSWRRYEYPQSIQLRGIVTTDHYVAKAWTQARLWRFGVRLGASATRDDYHERSLDGLDSNQYGVDFQFYGRVMPKLRALIEYNWVSVGFDEGRDGTLNDYQTHQVRVGIDGSLTPKLSASIKAGYTRQFADRVGQRDRREFEGFTAEISSGYQLLPQTSAQISFSRTVDTSFQSNFLISDRATLQIEQKIYTTITALASVGYTRADVSRVGRTTAHLNRFETGASVSWHPRGWLDFRLGYTFTRLGSEFPNNDYRVHEVVASVGIGL
jgi:hypothetical protein